MNINIKKFKPDITRIAVIIVFFTLIVIMLVISHSVTIGKSLTIDNMLPQDKLVDWAYSFESHLPIIVLQTNTELLNNRETPPRAVVWWFDGGDTNRLTDEPAEVFSYASSSYRGNSSYSFSPKKPYTLRFFDYNYMTELKVSFLGLAPSDTWVLRSPYADKSLLRDWFSYEVAASVLPVQPRGAPVQLFLQDGSDAVPDYQGVYFLCQHIPSMPNLSEVLGDFDLQYSDSIDAGGGGYVFQLDRNVPGNRVVDVGRDRYYRIMYPDSGNITLTQEGYIRNEIGFYHRFLNRYGEFEGADISNWDYRSYIDIEEFINFLLVAELLKNSDLGTFSTYTYRAAGGKFSLGPVWDSDLSLGNNQGNESYYGLFSIIHFHSYRYLFESDEFTAQFVETWQRYRNSLWSDAALTEMFDAMTAYLEVPAAQNAERWPELYDGQTEIWPNPQYVTSWEEEIRNIRSFLIQRLHWLDEHIPMLLNEGPNELDEMLKEQYEGSLQSGTP